MERSSHVDRPWKLQGSHLQGCDDVAACPVVFNLVVHQGEGENDVLILHPDAGIAVDGVELAELVGEDNIFTFGQSSEEVIEHYKKADYVSKEWYKKNKRLAAAVDFLIGEEMEEAGDKKLLKQLYDELLKKDWFMTFPDFESYCKAKDKALAAYEDRMTWAKKMVINIAKAGYFSSDRTIDQYNNDIWHLEKDC